MDLAHEITMIRSWSITRVMMRQAGYVISMKDHELPYGDWLTMIFEKFEVPLVDKKGEEPKRRRENVHEEEEEGQIDFDWEAVVDEASVQGESGSGEKFYDVEDEVQGSPEVNDEIPGGGSTSLTQRRKRAPSEVDPSGPSGRIRIL
ncbi:hypothetical protein Dimus_005727 [Dionaea muscipula]